MITRNNVLSKVVTDCLKDIYSFVQPKVEWDDFLDQNKIYHKEYTEWSNYNRAYNNRKENPEEWEKYKKTYESLDWEGKSITECIGPRPYEFYYISKDIIKDICDSYVHAYRIDQQQELLDTIEILKNYCKEPIVDKYIKEYTDEHGNWHPGYRGYDHPDNLQIELQKIIVKENPESNEQELASACISKFFEFLDMAGNFYNWNRDLDSFNTSIYLGVSPNSNKEAVIKNWKKYKGVDIEIDEEKMKKEYYGEDELD